MAHWTLSVIAGMLMACTTTHAPAAWAQIGQIKTVTGEVSIVHEQMQRPARVGDLLEQADVVITGVNSSVGITFIDNSRFSAGPRSRVELEQFHFDPTTYDGTFSTKLQHGTLAVISGHIAKRSPDAMQVRTPTTILGVRGTQLLLQVAE